MSEPISSRDALPRAAWRSTEQRGRGTSAAAGPRRRLPLSPVGLAQVIAVVAIVLGWSSREERWLVPHEGLGYALGIGGLAAMCLLLAYSLRKHLRFMRSWGPIGQWFQIHMILGLAGPLAILYHANFRLGSANANVALACMLAVAASGVVGRVIYVRIHTGLSGRRRTLGELRDELGSSRLGLSDGALSSSLIERLAPLERSVLEPAGGLGRRLADRATLRIRCRRALREIRRELRRAGPGLAAGERRAAGRAARRYVGMLRSVAAFTSWERLFSLWHVAHLPLCFLLFVTAAVHVVAVHMY